MNLSIKHQLLAGLLASGLALSTLALPCQAQADPATSGEAALKTIFASENAPLSVTLKELDESWKRVVINDTGNTNTEIQLMLKMAGFESGVHFTQGRTAIVGDNTFLLAYRLPVEIDQRFIDWHGHGPPPRPRKPTSDTVLRLSLLNLRSLNGIHDLRTFDPSTDMVNVAEENAASVRTLTQLGQGMLRYLRARGEFPEISNPLNWQSKRTFYPYVADERLYIHPGTLELYRWNEILSGKKAVHIPNPQSFAVFYEAEPSPDGTRGVLFMDGHVERLSPAHWQRVRMASKIEGDGNDEVIVEAPAPAPPGNVRVVPVPPPAD